MTNSDKKEAVIALLSDYILFLRICGGMEKALSAFDSVCVDFEPEAEYNGINIAFAILGIKNEDMLCDELGDISIKYALNKEGRCDVLAPELYNEWSEIICEYYMSNIKK